METHNRLQIDEDYYKVHFMPDVDTVIKYLSAINQSTILNLNLFSTVNYEYVIYLGQEFCDNSVVQELMQEFFKKIHDNFKYKSQLSVAVGHTEAQEQHAAKILAEGSEGVCNGTKAFVLKRPYLGFKDLNDKNLK